MSCQENIVPCGCGNNPCGCKISSDDVAYQGPDLNCTGVVNCDTLTEAIQKIDEYACSINLVQNIINTIINNITLYNQFVTIVNQTVDCQTVFNCLNTTTTTTTTLAPPIKLTLNNRDNYETTAACCIDGYAPTMDIYVNNGEPIISGFIYLDELRATIFDGGMKVYKIQKIDESFVCVRISTLGEVTELQTC